MGGSVATAFRLCDRDYVLIQVYYPCYLTNSTRVCLMARWPSSAFASDGKNTNRHFINKFWKCQKAEFFLPHDAK